MITLEQYIELKDKLVGFCLFCGHLQDNVDPDGRDIPCEECGHPEVFGVEELLVMGLVE